jgi:hypothetical protein
VPVVVGGDHNVVPAAADGPAPEQHKVG